MIDLIIQIVKTNPISWINNIDAIFINLINISVNKIIKFIDINTNIIITRYGKINTIIFKKILNIFNINFIISIIDKISITNEIKYINKIRNINYKL